MQYDYWFLDPAQYGPALQQFAITEPEYLAALQEVTNLFPKESSLQYYRAAFTRWGSLSHFDLLPYPNHQLPYNPVPILLNVTGGVLSQLLYLGLALGDFRKAIGQTKAFNDLTSEKQYRGALFEIEVGAELARSGLKPTYCTTSPDFILGELPLGIEASIREVPLPRAIAERLFGVLASFEFRHLYIDITVKGEHDIEEFMKNITEDIQRLLSEGKIELIQSRYRLGHDLLAPVERTVSIFLGKYRYEETLPHLITSRLADKEEYIRKALTGKAMINCVVALDTRSLLQAPFEAESEYERQLVEHNRVYFDRERTLRQQVITACQAFAADSHLIKGILLWGRKRLKFPEEAEAVHRRHSISLVTAENDTEVDKNNLAGELVKIAQGHS
jgi:hypothetical protein